MRAFRKKDTLTLEFNFLESTLLRNALGEISHNYKIKPDALDPEVAKWWYSTRGCKSARMTEEETKDWVANLHAAKSAHLGKILQWKKALGEKEEGPYRLKLTPEDAHTLLTVVNDHRLLLAGRFAIGEDELNCQSEEEFQLLSRGQQNALILIDLLDVVLVNLLRLLSPEAASWTETLSGESPL
jgi:hypothetical protein